MKTKTSILSLTKAFFILLVMCCFSLDSFAGVIIPIPIYHGGGGGNISIKDGIGLLIALNIPSVLIVLIRSFIWILKRPDWTYTEYVWYSDMDLITPDINTIWLVGLNGTVGAIALGMWIVSVL